MQPFAFDHVSTLAGAVQAAAHTEAAFLAGGTTLIDLMKLDVMRPDVVIDINRLADSGLGKIERTSDGMRLGALVRMADAAAHPDIRRDFPMIAQSLDLAASAQLRNMASLGGNVLQRTRCTYFRDGRTQPATNAAAAPAVRRSTASIACTPYSASATTASQPTPAISRKP